MPMPRKARRLTVADIGSMTRQIVEALERDLPDLCRAIEAAPAPRRRSEPTTNIYVLKEPDTGAVRYVGRSVNPCARYSGHMSAAEMMRPGIRDKKRWIADCALRTGRYPDLEVIEEDVPRSKEREREQWWIDKYLAEGCVLLNVAMP